MPKIVDHVEYKKKLIEQSFEIISRRGFAAVSMRDLSRALRISTGALYYYFPSKIGLFEAILQHYGVDNVKNQIKTAPETASFEEGLELLIASCEMQESLWAKITLLQVDAYREQDEKMLTYFNSIFASSTTKNHLSKLLHIEDPEVIDHIRALTFGIILQRVLSRKPIKWANQKRVLLQAFKQFAK